MNYPRVLMPILDKTSSELYNNKWRQYSLRYLKRNPFCVSCGAWSKVVDHIKPHKGDSVLFRDVNNHQALCMRCHDNKTRREVML